MKKKTKSIILSQEVLEYLRQEGREIAFSDGETIVHRGLPGKALYVVTSGKVEVRLVGDGGRQLPLVRLGEGNFFGEMALLTGEPVSADVVAISPATLLAYPAERFEKALAECAPLHNQIMAGLVDNLRSTTTDAWNFFQRAEALNVLMDTTGYAGPIITVSAKMRKVKERIEALSRGREPVLITGGPGTGKVFMAAKIHQEGENKDKPFVVVDCRSLSENEAGKFLFGSLQLVDEEGESSASSSLHLYGALHLANMGTLVLRNVDAISRAAQENLARYLEKSAEGTIEFPSTRVMATTQEDIPALAEKDNFYPELANQLAVKVLDIPNLLERRHDILPLARTFLAERVGQEERRLSDSAEHALVSQRYNHRNVAELKEAVDMAALFADGPEIGAEHIFTGPKEEEDPADYDLSQTPLVQRLIHKPVLDWVRAIVFAVFSIIILVCLTVGDTGVGQVTNSFVWGFWWPSIMFLSLFVGRVWCSVCPLSSAGRLAARIKKLGQPPPAWMKKYSVWLIMVGFLVIILVEHIYKMTTTPFAVGILLLTLMSLIVIFSVIYQRETWCRYICPMGNLAAIYSLPATVDVHANPSVCATYCSTHECFKGSTTQSGCPVFHHPLYSRDSHFCKLCLTCLRVCPHGSARLYLRPPLQNIWRQGDLGAALNLFALFVFFVSLFMLSSSGTTWFSTTVGFTLTIILAVALAVIFRQYLPRLLSREKDPDPAMASRVAFSLMVLAWGPAMAFHMGHIPGLQYLRIYASEGSFLANRLPAGEISLLSVLQLGAIAVAGLFTAFILWRIKARFVREEVKTSPWGWKILLILCLIYLLTAARLVMPGVHP